MSHKKILRTKPTEKASVECGKYYDFWDNSARY